MATPVWSPGTPYPTGSLVQPLTAIEPVPTSLDNPGFDLGNTTGWVFSGAGSAAVTTLNSQAGTYNLGLDNGVVEGQNTENPSANPGLTIRAQIYVRLSQSGTSAGRVRLWWYDAANVLIGTPVDGNLVQKPGSQSERWVLSSLSAVAPALTASVKIGFWSNSGVGDGDTRVDSLSWDYTSASAPSGLIFEATQVGLGISAGTEPAWPTAPGIPVTDGTVIWEGVIANRVVWEASPIMVSGGTEPTWPIVVGESVTDGTISWETVSLRVEDENCPNSKVVTIASSKVYAADSDIVRYSATVNPLDWTTPDDAGYLPTGLNQYGSNNTAVLNTYRSNVVPFSASTFQNWQVDPDPANITLLDSMEGIGSTWQHAAQPVSNDLFYLAALGVRTVGIAAGTSNLAAGDAGMPIDPLVRRSIIAAEGNETDALGMYFPSLGQYWLAFPDFPPDPPVIQGDLQFWGIGLPLTGFSYTGTYGVRPYSFALFAGTSLPPGLVLNSDGSVTGTPTLLGEFTWQVQLTDAFGSTSTLTDTAEIVNGPLITGDAPDPSIGIFYSYAYTITVGDAPIDAVEIVSGSIPDGMTLSAVGVLFGTPTSDGGATYEFTIRVTDDNGIWSEVTNSISLAALVSAYLPLNTDFTDLTGRTWTQIVPGDPVSCQPAPTADGSGSMVVDLSFNFPSNIGIKSTLGSGAPGTGPFCLEGYFYVGSAWDPATNGQIGLAGFVSAPSHISVRIRKPADYGDATPVFEIFDGTTGAPNTREGLSEETWYHWALSRDINDDNWLFINGKKSEAPLNNSMDLTTVFEAWLGCAYGAAYSFIRNVDNCRLTTGWSRYTEDFIPPPAPMPYP